MFCYGRYWIVICQTVLKISFTAVALQVVLPYMSYLIENSTYLG